MDKTNQMHGESREQQNDTQSAPMQNGNTNDLDSRSHNRDNSGMQGVSYTTGVPAMCGALMLLTGKWTTKGVHTVEEFDPDPYLDALDKYGLPRSESHAPALVD